MTDKLLEIQNIYKKFYLYSSRLRRLFNALGLCSKGSKTQEIQALKDITFDLAKGECLGIIGPNGAGKSTLLKIISGCMVPTDGNVIQRGRILSLLELSAGFNLSLTGRENIFQSGKLLGYSIEELDRAIESIEAFADIGKFFDLPIKLYSSGMFARLGFSMYSHLPCEIFIIDETFAVGDIFFIQKCFLKLEDLMKQGQSILLVTHDMNAISKFCQRAMLINEGALEYIGDPKQAISQYYHLERSGKRVDDSKSNKNDPELQEQITQEMFPWPETSESCDMNSLGLRNANYFKVISFYCCDQNLKSCNSFHPGEKLLVFYEVEIVKFIGVPIGSIAIWNEKNISIYGKSTYQTKEANKKPLQSGQRLRFMHEITLSIAEGVYTIELGMAGIPEETLGQLDVMSDEMVHSQIIPDAVTNKATAFSVMFGSTRNIENSHHGLVNLKSSIKTYISNKE